MDERLKIVFAFLIGAGWLFNLVAPAFFQNYDSNLAANAPLLLVLGSLYASKKKSGDE